jgi:hypothetical protein
VRRARPGYSWALLKISSVILAAAVVLHCGSALAQQQQSAPPELGLHEIADSEMDRYIAKSNGVVGLLNASLRGKESWNRYLG